MCLQHQISHLSLVTRLLPASDAFALAGIFSSLIVSLALSNKPAITGGRQRPFAEASSV